MSQEEGRFNKSNSTRRERHFFTSRLVLHAITEEEVISVSVPEHSDMSVSEPAPCEGSVKKNSSIYHGTQNCAILKSRACDASAF